MVFKSKFVQIIFLFCIVLFMTVLAFGDTIRLKDGRIIKGKIISFNGGKFTVLFDDGTRQRQMSYSADEIESITFDADSTPTANVETLNQTPSGSSDKTKIGNDTIITVGQNKNPDNTPTPSPKVSPPANTSAITPAPITLNVKVMADNTSNGWTNSGWVARKGQKIKITGGGRVSLGNGRLTSPGGIASLSDSGKLKKDEPTGGLIAVIGDDNNDFIFIGDSLEFVAARDGALFLGVNEGNLNDNSGAFDVKIEIDPETSN
ncbi:hypothetical protein BH18ACI1_BH18ACI1_00230 [soil metagenome]